MMQPFRYLPVNSPGCCDPVSSNCSALIEPDTLIMEHSPMIKVLNDKTNKQSYAVEFQEAVALVTE
ncbi:hypothetical protein [Celerinatantimonas diazotrophica]|uniref:hypothetical protein n=1 Tax=Celerinatantimonas diazotrophica TaxID=412034 RepID=UPI00104D5FE9|nr:hypothetical protein [Celerinatantimonas diazotrophica]CAG9297060.1 hypothetical protein CEDIAZO_02222 [Celerinatantimonas diazotrophica]